MSLDDDDDDDYDKLIKQRNERRNSPPVYIPYDDSDDSDDKNETQTRKRSNALQIQPDSIFNASKEISLGRTSSIGAENQLDEGTCFAYSSARLITRCITQLIPTYFNITSDESNMLYTDKTEENKTKYENCFVNNSKDLEIVRETLSFKNKCSIPKRYNHMILFYYTLFTIKKKYGCNGYITDDILTIFSESPENFYGFGYEIQATIEYSQDNTRGYIISKEVDESARRLIQLFVNFIHTNKIDIDNVTDLLPLNGYQTHESNWITNFPEGAKRALENKMYVGFSFSMPSNQWGTIGRRTILDTNPVPSETCNPPVSRHAVVITKWEPGYITIINSWGTGWGNRGLIRIPSENFYKFVMNPSCEEFENSRYAMKFMYFNIEKNRKLYNLNVKLGTTTRPVLPATLGGKTRKSKKIKLTKKNKSKRKSKRKSKKQ